MRYLTYTQFWVVNELRRQGKGEIADRLDHSWRNDKEYTAGDITVEHGIHLKAMLDKGNREAIQERSGK
jgi:hypothetical protein